MRFRIFCGILTSGAIAFVAACSGSPAQPSAVVGVPTPTLPANNAQIAFNSQPITLVAGNASVTNATAGALYVFEVAGDAGFANKLQTKQVAQDTSGQTSVVLDTLASGKDYYWHVRVQAGSTTGQFSSAQKFSIVPFGAPTAVSPINGATVGMWPKLVVANAQTSGPTGALMYKFEVSSSSTFDAIVSSGTVPETPNQTSFLPSGSLPGSQTTMYWHATATDSASGVSSPTSAAQNFVLNPSAAARLAAQVGVVLWPNAQPTGTNGQAVMGDNWAPTTMYHVPTHTYFQSPTAEMLRIFDLIDRGYDVQVAINWMNGNGYPTIAYWYLPPEKAVIGLQYVYIACTPPSSYPHCGKWDVVLKTE